MKLLHPTNQQLGCELRVSSYCETEVVFLRNVFIKWETGRNFSSIYISWRDTKSTTTSTWIIMLIMFLFYFISPSKEVIILPYVICLSAIGLTQKVIDEFWQSALSREQLLSVNCGWLIFFSFRFILNMYLYVFFSPGPVCLSLGFPYYVFSLIWLSVSVYQFKWLTGKTRLRNEP